MIQILGLRDYSFKGKLSKREVFFENNWRAANISELFSGIETLIAQIPVEERYNLYYTAASCLEESGRKLEYQEVIPFDIDDIDTEKIEEYVSFFLGVFGLARKQVIIVASGNGVQFLIGTRNKIMYDEYFEETRLLYKGVCGTIAQTLYMAGLQGTVDTSVWSKARILRLPMTENRKKDRPVKQATLLNGTIDFIDFDFKKFLGLPEVAQEDQIHPNMLKRISKPDNEGVQEGCGFLKHCYTNQATIDEPSWYAMLSIIGRLDGGNKLIHEYSNKHKDYSAYDCERKAEQALDNAGPRTCNNINSLWKGCQQCPHWGKVNSPITIKGKKYIKTKDTGFYHMVIDAKGEEKRGKPDYEGMMVYFESKHKFVVQIEGGIVHTWDGNKYVARDKAYVHHFAEENFDPKPDNKMCSEFFGKVQRNNLKPIEFFTVENKINFNNGVLDLESKTLDSHSPSFGFKYCLPFAYNPDATCRRFTQYLGEVTRNDAELSSVLLEYMAYALTPISPTVGQKALILTGGGSNGKSVFLDVLKHLAGRGNYSTLSMGYEISKLENRYQLDGKLFNISEETPSNSMVDNSFFKAIVTGGEVQARKLYHDAYSMQVRAKIIMACNELPPNNDVTNGMYRRLLIAPFNATFDGVVADKFLRDKLYAEASGIFNLVLEHYAKFVKTGEFTTSKAIEQSIEEYKADNDPVRSWLAYSVLKKEGAFIVINDAYSKYSMSAVTGGEKPVTLKSFSKRFHTLFGTDTNRVTINGERVRRVEGVTYRDQQESNNF